MEKGAAMKTLILATLLALSGVGAIAAAPQIERGRGVALEAGCVACHSPNGRASPERGWLTGNTTGQLGAWGTTYASNLRVSLSRMSEDTWVRYAAKLKVRPPMPADALRQLGEEDLRALYRYVRDAGVAGAQVPYAMAPGQLPPPPYVAHPGAIEQPGQAGYSVARR
jgi:mono/diheme cytochrome c family protein